MFRVSSLAVSAVLVVASFVVAQQEEFDRMMASWPMARGNVTSTGSFSDSVGDSFDVEWEFKYPKGAFESGPIIAAVDGKPTVFVAGIDVNVRGKLISIDIATGESNWDSEIEEGFVSPPAFHEGKLFVGDMAGMLYCFDAQKGSLIWQYETMGQINAGANFYDDFVLFGSEDSSLYAIERETGKLKWKYTVEDQVQCGPTIAGDFCFLAGCDSKLHIIGLKDGKKVDSVEIGSPTGTTAAALGDSVFFGTEQGTFFSINYETPEINWKWEDAAGATSIRSSAAVTKDSVVFGARNRRINCLNPNDGSMIWATKVKAKVDGSPIIAGDRVYAGSTDGRLYSINLSDGEILWQKQFNGAFLGSPAIVGGEKPRLVVATERGTVYCLKPAG